MSTTVRVDVESSGETAAALSEAYRRCDADDSVRAVVVTGAGRAFCAGADMTAQAAAFGTPEDGFSASPVQPPAWRVRKLVIPQVRRGMIGDCAVHYTLKRAVGLAVAADVLLTGRTFTPDEAAAKETTVHLKLMGSPDAAEGPASWRENRPPGVAVEGQ